MLVLQPLGLAVGVHTVTKGLSPMVFHGDLIEIFHSPRCNKGLEQRMMNII